MQLMCISVPQHNYIVLLCYLLLIYKYLIPTGSKQKSRDKVPMNIESGHRI